MAWDFDRSGIYVGASGIYALDMALEDAVEEAASQSESGAGLKVKVEGNFGIQGRLGYRILPHFAVELQAEYIFPFDVEAGGAKIAEYDALTATANAKLILATKGIQPYLLAGGGIMYASVEDKVGLGVSEDGLGPVFRGGGGIDFYLTESIVVSVESTYVLPFEEVDELDYLSIGLGLQYRF
jgi:opacity protein-like surface antigen